MKISLIVAMGLERQIGIEGKMPWHLPTDLLNFKKLTMGHTLVFGRKTFESVGRALPGRKTIILTRDPNYTAPNCLTAQSVEDAIKLAEQAGETELFIAGGSEVYAKALPYVQRMYLTMVNFDGKADTFFPPYSTEGWKQTFTHFFPPTEKELDWQYQVWDRD
jgi:dihydrofolate reductase